ncbi:MAG TPA: HD domain-containing phosphohydrolase [Spirochaetales bacterium]|nr:HD domain-containing phosphohydrolase [Spirochaetales bacterium]
MSKSGKISYMGMHASSTILHGLSERLDRVEEILRREPARAVAEATELEREAGAAAAWPEAARAARLAGYGDFYGSRLRDARLSFQRALAHLGRYGGDRAEESRVRSGLGGALYQLGDFERAFRELARAVRLARGAGDAERIRALNNYAVALSESGREDEARIAIEEAVQIASSDPVLAERYRITLEVNLSDSYRALGRKDEALAHARMAAGFASSSNDQIGIGTAAAAEANALVALGRNAEAVERFRASLEAHRSLGVSIYAIDAAAEFARLLLDADRVGEAERVVFEWLPAAESVDALNAPDLLRAAAGVHAARGRYREAYLASERAGLLERQGGPAAARQAALETVADRSIRRAKATRRRFKRWQDVVLRGLVELLGERDGETRDHVERTAEIVWLVGRELARRKARPGFDAREVADLALIAPLHDIGKVSVRDAVFGKTGPLDSGEQGEMRAHAEAGRLFFRRAALDGIKDRHLSLAADVAGAHHERWDGSGYPHGLKGEDIPFGARIMAVADVYDAIRSERPYKRSRTRDEALEYVKANAGTHFDPAVVDAFMAVEPRVDALYEGGAAAFGLPSKKKAAKGR